MYDIDEICEKVNGVFSKKISLKISRISSLKSAKKNEISFFSHLKYYDDLKQSKASVFLVSNSLKNKVDSLEQDAITDGQFSDLFYEEQSNNDLLTRDDLRDTVSEELDNILDELKITRQ